MFGRFLLLIFLVPALELWILIELTKRTNFWTTIVVVLLTGVVGLSLVRWQGLMTLTRIRRQLSSGRSPSQSIISGVLLLVAGALLLTPGLLTDTVGFLLLIPGLRTVLAAKIKDHLVRNVAANAFSFDSSFVRTESAEAVAPGVDAPDESKRAHVRVVDPNQPRLNE